MITGAERRVPGSRLLAGAVAAAVGVSALLFAGGAAAQTVQAPGCQYLGAKVYQSSKPTGTSLLTTSASENANAAGKYGYTVQDGAIAQVATTAQTGTAPIYRLYNPKTFDFRWAPAGAALDSAVAAGYVNQQREFYASIVGGTACIPVHRYVKGAINRIAATDAKRAALEAEGFKRQEIAFYAAAVAKPAATTTPAPPTTTAPTTSTRSTTSAPAPTTPSKTVPTTAVPTTTVPTTTVPTTVLPTTTVPTTAVPTTAVPTTTVPAPSSTMIPPLVVLPGAPTQTTLVPTVTTPAPSTTPVVSTPPDASSPAPSSPAPSSLPTSDSPSTPAPSMPAPSTPAPSTADVPSSTAPVSTVSSTSAAPSPSNPVPPSTSAPSSPVPPTGPTPPSTADPRVIEGDLVADKPGQLIDNVEVHGSIIVRAPDVTIRNSIVTGGTNAAARRYWPLVDARAGYPNLRIEDTVIAEATPSEWNASGIGGSNFTARGVKIVGQVDSINITGSNVTIEDSVMGKNVYYPDHWQSQKSGGTHNDSVQVLRGDNITIRGNIMTDSNSLGVMAAPEWGSVLNLLVENNYIDNGECSSKFTDKGGNANSMIVRNNVFGGHQRSWKCYIVTAGSVNATVSGNVLSNGKTPGSPADISSTRSSTPVVITRGQL